MTASPSRSRSPWGRYGARGTRAISVFGQASLSNTTSAALLTLQGSSLSRHVADIVSKPVRLCFSDPRALSVSATQPCRLKLRNATLGPPKRKSCVLGWQARRAKHCQLSTMSDLHSAADFIAGLQELASCLQGPPRAHDP